VLLQTLVVHPTRLDAQDVYR